MYPSGEERITPDLSPRRTTARVAYVNRCTGLGLSAAQICHLLQKMGHSASPSPSAPEAEVTVDVPATRPDILHECDLMEDVAVAYGFDNLPKTFPSTNTVAAPLPINKVGDLMRRECACSGWVEVLPLILVSLVTPRESR